MQDIFRIAGIDVHKKMLAVVVTNIAAGTDFQFERRKFGAMPNDVGRLAQWLAEQDVKEVVMESTAQYWKPVWWALEGQCKLHLAQAQSNRAPRGRKQDFSDAERLVRRLVAGELQLSYVPEREQRLWRTMTHTREQLSRDRARLINQLEALLEEGRLKLSSVVSDLVGVSSRRMLKAIAKGEQDPQKLAELASPSLRATPEQLREIFSTSAELGPIRLKILAQFLTRLELLEQQIKELDQMIAEGMRAHGEQLARLAEVPGFGVCSAQQTIAQLGPSAAAFPSAPQLSSWIGTCPGREESAEVSKSDRSPKGNRSMRRLLGEIANATVKTKGSSFRSFYQRLAPRIGHNKAIWAVAHKLCRIIWMILHEHVRYKEHGTVPSPENKRHRAKRLVRQLRKLGYQIGLEQVLATEQP